MASCDNDQECTSTPTTITPSKLPAQSGGGVEIVSTLPSADSAQKGIIYIYLTDPTDTSTFVGAFVLNDQAGELVNISSEGGAGHTYSFEDTADGWRALQDGTVIYTYVDKTLAPATTTTLGGVIVGSNLTVDENGVLAVDIDTELSSTSTKPVTNSAIYAVVGDVESLLSAING